jgi:hypothetical protein
MNADDEKQAYDLQDWDTQYRFSRNSIGFSENILHWLWFWFRKWQGLF